MTDRRYSTVAVALHWAIAILILGQIAGGLYMHNLPNTAPAKFDLFQLHKSFGVSILALTILRLGWRLPHKSPPMPSEMPGWQVLAARATHWLFYFLMLATPIVGLAIVSVSPKDIPTEWFGLFGVPHLGFLSPGADPAATEYTFIELHEKLSYAILTLLVLHIAAALKHGFINRDGVLRSMAPGLGAGAGVAVVFVALGAGVGAYFSGKGDPGDIAVSAAGASVETVESKHCDGASKLAVNWRVDPAKSSLQFVGTQGGRSFNGTFSEFTAEIAFNDDSLERSWIHVSVRTETAATGDQLIDTTIPGREWFNVQEHDAATFTACDIQRTGDGEYHAVGALTIKNISQDITLPFALEIDGKTASAVGGVDLIRTDFDLGAASSWLDAEGVAVEARVNISILAEQIN